MTNNYAAPDAASYDVEADDPNPADPTDPGDPAADPAADPADGPRAYSIDGRPCTREEWQAHGDAHTTPDPDAPRAPRAPRAPVTGLSVGPGIGRRYSEVAREAEEEAKAARLADLRRRASIAKGPSAPLPAVEPLRRKRVPPKHAKGQGCFCGCGLSAVGYFVPGHDSKLRQKLGVKLTGDALLDAALAGGFGPKGK